MLCHSCNPAFCDPFDCWGWGTKCWISSGYIAFIPFFRVFSWNFLPFRSLFCLSVVLRQSKIFLSFSYILFYLDVVPNLCYIAFIPFFRVFSWDFLPSQSLFCLSAVVHQSVTSYFLPIYYSPLVYYQIYTLIFAQAFLELFLVWLLFWGIPMYDYFGLLLHRLLLGTTISITFFRLGARYCHCPLY